MNTSMGPSAVSLAAAFSFVAMGQELSQKQREPSGGLHRVRRPQINKTVNRSAEHERARHCKEVSLHDYCS